MSVPEEYYENEERIVHLQNRLDIGCIIKKETNCWEWNGPYTKAGYGILSIGYKGKSYNENAHRLAWILYYGYPGKKFVCHICDNRKCINLDHLFLGTNVENMQDASKKDRLANFAILRKQNLALKICGHANWEKCHFCKQYDDPKNLSNNTNGIYHKLCAAKYQKAWKEAKYE